MISIIILSLLGLFCMMSGLFKPSTKFIVGLSIGVILGSGVLFLTHWDNFYLIPAWDLDITYYNDMAFFDNYAISFSILLSLIVATVFSLSEYHFNQFKNYHTEHIALFIFALIGMIIMVSFDHLAMLFVGIEIMSIPLYILAGVNRKDTNSNESSIKYFLMGAFASGLLLMGMTLIYGETSSFHLDLIADYIQTNPAAVGSPILAIGVLLVFAGMLFKVSAFPFHFWTPDVYQGAPTLVTTFMSTSVKVAGFAAFFRLFYNCFLDLDGIWSDSLAIISVLTITVGGVTAVFQNSMKRLLAFSSISHAGYLLITLLVANDLSSGSTILYYGATYAFASIAAFAVIMVVENYSKSDTVDSFNGLAKSNPLLAFVMTVAMLSLAGIPITGGFFAKFYILSSAIEADYYWIAVIAIINAIIGVYYYFKVIIAMYFKEQNSTSALPISIFYSTILVVLVLVIILLGVFPDVVYSLF